MLSIKKKLFSLWNTLIKLLHHKWFNLFLGFLPTCFLQVRELNTLLNLWRNDQLFAHLSGASPGVISRNPRKQTEWYPSRKIGTLSQGDNNPAVARGIIYIFYLAECIIQKSNWRSDPEYIIQRDIIFSGLRLSGNNTWITNTPQPSRNGCVLSGLKMKRIEKFLRRISRAKPNKSVFCSSLQKLLKLLSNVSL